MAELNPTYVRWPENYPGVFAYCRGHGIMEDTKYGCSKRGETRVTVETEPLVAPDGTRVCRGCRHLEHFWNECLGNDGDCPCKGLGSRAPDDSMEVNSEGGRQSRNPFFPSAFPAAAFLRVCRVLKEGAESHEDDPFPKDLAAFLDRNWHKIPGRDHLDHLLVHVFKLLRGDKTEDHPGHVATRAVMFLEMYLKETGEEP